MRQFWDSLGSSFWFVPAVLVATSAIFAVLLIEADSAANDRMLAQWPRLFGAGPEGAIQMLSMLASSMMTVMGVTFSMTLVALALASSQYTSRVLRNFMRSRVTQGTLGTFAGTFVYCLIVLRTIRGGVGEAEFVPSMAVFFAFVLSLGGVGVLIFFIHHIASSIQASSIIASVAEETMAAIDRLFPEKLGDEPPENVDGAQVPPAQQLVALSWTPVPAAANGYIVRVDNEALLRLARENRTIVRMEHGIGAFVVKNTALASLFLNSPADQSMIRALNACYSIRRHRTVEQDVAFGIRQIVDMALKALSPGVNDTSTAVMCVDYLSAILASLAPCSFPSSHRYEHDELRVIVIAPAFEALLAEAFDQIRDSAAGNVAVLRRVLAALDTLGTLTTVQRHRQALRDQARWIAELADRSIASPHAREQIEQRLAQFRARLDSQPPLTVPVSV